MSGLYIHIPYCKQKCIYCDFYSCATKESKSNYISAIKKDIKLNKDTLSDNLKTIYFGGGTPSTLSPNELESIFITIENNFDLSDIEEVTFEANPENLNKEYLSFLHATRINRLSIGIQSFDDNDLKILSRRHSCIDAIKAIENAQNIGFSNISIDLMFNLPNMDINKWSKNLSQAINLNTQHISCYSLTPEEGTMLDKLIKKNKISLPSEEEQLKEFDYCMDFMQENGFEHYETSNYALKGFRSLHNSNYWNNTPYLGVGASAHSFNNNIRRSNIADINTYCQNIRNNTIYFEEESLCETDLYNEYILVGTRIKEGLSIEYIKNNFSATLGDNFLKRGLILLERGLIYLESNHFLLTKKGIHLANQVAVEFMYDK